MQSALLQLQELEKLFEQQHPKHLWVASLNNTGRRACGLLNGCANQTLQGENKPLTFRSRRLSGLIWITGKTSLRVLIEILFDGIAIANPANFILYNIRLERNIPTDTQTMGSCSGAVLNAGVYMCTQKRPSTPLNLTRAQVCTESRRHRQQALKRRRRCRGETKPRKMSRKWAR